MLDEGAPAVLEDFNERFDGNREEGTVGAAVGLVVFCFVLGDFILFLLFLDLFLGDLDCFLLS